MDRLTEAKFKLFDLIGYKIHHRNVRRFHESTAKLKVCCAPRRTSKSYSASMDSLMDCLLPDKRIWVVGPSYSLAEKEFRYIHETLVLGREKLGLPKPVTCLTNARSGQLFMRFPWNTVVEGKTADRPESLLGDAVDRVIYSEAAQLPRAIHERYVAPTLITKQGTAVIATTPDAAAEWVYELFQMGQEGIYPGIESFTWDISANPGYPHEEMEKARKMYGEDSPVFREQYLGEWVFYTGLVYNSFQKDLHVIEPFDIPKGWHRIRGIDFGHRDPFVCLWCAVGPSGELYFYKEYYNREGQPMKYHAERIKEMSIGEIINQTVADSESSQSIDDLCFEGIPCYGADKHRREGRMKVMEYMMPTDDGICPFSVRDTAQSVARNKWPRMYFFNTLKETLREIKFYRWKEGRQVEGDKERTEGDDHCLHPDTIVITEKGKKKIKELVGTKGRILTFEGKWTDYENCRLTAKNQPLVEVGFDDGSKIICTKDHKFLTSDGWIPAIDMEGRYCYDAVSQNIRRKNLWKSKLFQKQYKNLVESNTIAADFIFKDEVKGYTKLYGNFITELYPRDFTSIIKMKINQIINLPIWNLNKIKNICQIILKAIQEFLAIKPSQPLPFGTRVRLADYGIGNNMKNSKLIYIKPKTDYASIVEKNIRKEFVQNVKNPSKAINIVENKLAPVNVLQKSLYVKEAGESDVYCLDVPETNAFAVENGIIVHNCMDTLRYIVNTRPSPFIDVKKTPAYSFNYFFNKMRASKLNQNYIGI